MQHAGSSVSSQSSRKQDPLSTAACGTPESDGATTPAALVLCHPDNRVAFVDLAFSQLFGYEPQAVVGRPLDDILDPSDRAPESKSVAASTEAAADTPETEKRFTHHDGRTVRTRVTQTLLRGPDGQPLYVACVIELVASAAEDSEGSEQDSEAKRLLAIRRAILG